jgi:8-oxo-dGTP pyrophosphatase MutT (NUDIX family)
MKKEYRAGIVPYYIDGDVVRMLFMKPSEEMYGGKYFQIAKGKRDGEETDSAAALREGFEELGLLEENIEKLDDMGVYLGRTRIFIAKIKNKDNFVEFCFETKETKWLTCEQFKKEGRVLHFQIVFDIVEKLS